MAGPPAPITPLAIEIDPVALASRLIACPSVTPVDAGALDVAADALSAIGFTVHRLTSGAPPDGPVRNLYAIRGSRGPHLAFAGHTDVVPAGAWPDAFAPRIEGGTLIGRGAADMKGAVAAAIAAAVRLPTDHPGTLSFILTGDEEGPAVHGTRAILDWMGERGHRPDLCLVGEPTSVDRIGDTIKIGRRGSVNIWIDMPGGEGHVAYPTLADNPLPRLVRALARLGAERLDEGTAFFQPSNLELTELRADNPAANVIPGHAAARLNIRFNDAHRGADLVERVRAIVLAEAPRATVEARISGEAFVTEPGPLTGLVADAIAAETGVRPALSTSGGTSDARFLSRICPTVEFGLINATMHKTGEAVAVADLNALSAIYERIMRTALASPFPPPAAAGPFPLPMGEGGRREAPEG